MTDPEAKQIIDAEHARTPLAKAARHVLRRFLDAQGTLRAMKAIIEALQGELKKRDKKA
jgi:hypothetical protein